ncbi:hypothetical protein D3C76_1838740 [compost metagenome]
MGQAHAIGGTCRPHADTQRQRVDEHPQCPLGTLAALQAAEQHGAEHHFFAPGQLGQYLRPGLVHQAGDTHAQ